MIIKTKYDIGDTLYTIHNNEVYKFKAFNISVSIENNEISIKYGIFDFFPEDKCFHTKEELLKSL